MNKKTKQALLLAPLLSPLMIMTAPVTAEPIQHSYNHTVQTSSAFYDSQVTGACYSTSTFNGTQTFSYDGTPTDSDSDSDQSGSDC